MIIDAISTLVLNALSILISILPSVDGSFVDTLTSYNTAFREFIAQMNWLFPVNTVLLMLRIFITIELAIFGFKFVRWIIRNITAGHLS